MTAQETCEHLQSLFNIFGVPKKLVSDRGTAFTAHEFTLLMNSFKIKHRKVAVASPWANGLAERANRFLKTSLTKLVDEVTDWKTVTSDVQYVANNTEHSSIRTSPSNLLLGYE